MNKRKKKEKEKKGGTYVVPNECGLDNILIMDIRVVPHLFRLLAFLKLLYIIHEKGKRELRSYLKVLI